MSEVMHKGIVSVSDGNGQPRPMRAVLKNDELVLQKEEILYSKPSDSESTSLIDSRERVVTVIRRKVGGLGLSVKGGAENKLPILISRIYRDQAADLTRQLYVGDAIFKVNNKNIERFTHDDAVKLLTNAGNHVILTYCKFKLLGRKENDTQTIDNNIGQTKICCKLEKKWTDVITFPLLMAYLTRYITGSDNIRYGIYLIQYMLCGPDIAPSGQLCGPDTSAGHWSGLQSGHCPGWTLFPPDTFPGPDNVRTTQHILSNSFEVSNHNSMFMSIIYCEDIDVLKNWVDRILVNINKMNTQHMNSINKKFVSGETVSYMSWVEEGKFTDRHPWSTWRPRFLALKGVDALLFDTPPITFQSWLRPDCTFKVHQTMLKVLKDTECQDNRPNCFILQSCEGSVRYFSLEHKNDLLELEHAWQKATYSAVTKLGSKTFPALVNDRSAALTLDWNMGFALYDTEEKNYLWKYRFSYLKGSSDDGNSRLKLHFQEPDCKEMETKELETPSLQSLLFSIHSFLTAKIVSVDPSFLQTS
uniref:PDZ domain-containing protein n=1 Tax=Strigamia maritima TaxID=126957 RepID=T1J6X0_STRMM